MKQEVQQHVGKWQFPWKKKKVDWSKGDPASLGGGEVGGYFE